MQDLVGCKVRIQYTGQVNGWVNEEGIFLKLDGKFLYIKKEGIKIINMDYVKCVDILGK